MQGPTLPIQQLQQSQTCILSVFLIHHTHQTLPQVISMFGPLKEAMGGKKFRSDEELRHTVHKWLCRLPKEFFSKGIYALCKRWRTCIERGGDYVEK